VLVSLKPLVSRPIHCTKKQTNYKPKKPSEKKKFNAIFFSAREKNLARELPKMVQREAAKGVALATSKLKPRIRKEKVKKRDRQRRRPRVSTNEVSTQTEDISLLHELQQILQQQEGKQEREEEGITNGFEELINVSMAHTFEPPISTLVDETHLLESCQLDRAVEDFSNLLSLASYTTPNSKAKCGSRSSTPPTKSLPAKSSIFNVKTTEYVTKKPSVATFKMSMADSIFDVNSVRSTIPKFFKVNRSRRRFFVNEDKS
jgi:hypothetical protein